MARRYTTPKSSTSRSAADIDDVLLEKTIAATGWAQRNRQTLIVGGILIAATVLGGLYYLNYRRGHAERAAVELVRVQEAVAFGDTATAKVELGRYIESFGGTAYADEARLLLGQLYLQSNQADEAARVLGEAADVSEPLGRQAAMLLAKTRAQQGDLDEAETLLIRVADEAELNFEEREALEEAARIRLRQGDREGAAELYQRILDDMEENDPGRGVYEMRLNEVRASGA